MSSEIDNIINTNLRKYKPPDLTNISIEKIQYAAGLTDIIGCFQVSEKKLKFYIIQTERYIDTLHFMYDTFGGIITIHTIGNDDRQTSYDWILYQEDASQYANLILPYLLVKEREAIVFIKDDISINRIDIKLRKYNNLPHDKISNDIIPSNVYIAGLMDGGGCFNVNGKSGQHHSVTLKYRSILDMLFRIYGGSIYQRTANDTFGWEVHTEAKKLIQDIYPYIKGKKKQVELLFNMKPGEAPEIHVKLHELKNKFTSQTPRIDALKDGAPGIRATVTKPHTNPKKLPTGVYPCSNSSIVAQIQYNKKIYRLGLFNLDETEEAHELYLKYKKAISEEKKGGPKVDLENIKFIERKIKNDDEAGPSGINHDLSTLNI
jgi:hypothetical protein